MSTLMPFRVTLSENGVSKFAQANSRASVLRSALFAYKHGAKAVKFEHFANGAWVSDHDAQQEFAEKTAEKKTSKQAVGSLMQLEHTANALHKHAAKAPLEPEHHEQLLFAALSACRDAGITDSQLMDMVYKAYPSVKGSMEAAFITAKKTVAIPVSGPLEELANSR